MINRKLDDDYVKHWIEFEFLDGVFEALQKLDNVFGNIVVVTNQQCIGKGIITTDDLDLIHRNMLYEINYLKGRIDRVYYSPYLHADNHPTRKPGIGMALKAKADFPGIDFERSVIVGDSLSDMEFGRNAGMKTVYVSERGKQDERIDYRVSSLLEFANAITAQQV